MANKPCKRCGRTNWWWSDIDKCSKCEGEDMTTAVTEPKEVDPKEAERKQVLEDAMKILKEYGGQESNIPINNGYWDQMNRYRDLAKDTRGVEIIEPMDQKIKEIIDLAASDSASAKKAFAAIKMVVEDSTTPIPPGGPVTASVHHDEEKHHNQKKEK